MVEGLPEIMISYAQREVRGSTYVLKAGRNWTSFSFAELDMLLIFAGAWLTMAEKLRREVSIKGEWNMYSSTGRRNINQKRVYIPLVPIEVLNPWDTTGPIPREYKASEAVE